MKSSPECYIEMLPARHQTIYSLRHHCDNQTQQRSQGARKQGKWIGHSATLEDFFDTFDVSQSNLLFLDSTVLLRNDDLQARLSDVVGMPNCLLSEMCKRHNGYFGSQSDYNLQDELVTHRSWFKFQIKEVAECPDPFPNRLDDDIEYVWHDCVFFLSWNRSGSHQIICFDIREQSQQDILSTLNTQSPSRHGTICMPHCALVSAIVTLYDGSVWRLRDWIRAIEKERMKRPSPESDYPVLHELARHACHSSETLAVGLDVMARMSAQYKAIVTEYPRAVSNGVEPMLQFLDFQTSLLNGVRARSTANETRLDNEKNLTFNIVAQEESRATVRISKAAQKDSAKMKAIAVVTMLFLPSTFVSTMFSMTFFSFNSNSQGGNDTWSNAVSNKLWLYFAISIPLTILAFVVWRVWQRQDSHPDSDIV